MSSRPACPRCRGLGYVPRFDGGDGEYCPNCDDGTMRGVTDETPEERRIDDLQRRLAEIAIPLEVLMASDAAKPIAEISPALRQALNEALRSLRAEVFGVAR